MMGIISARLRFWNARAAHRRQFSYDLNPADVHRLNDEIGAAIGDLGMAMPLSNDERERKAGRQIRALFNRKRKRIY